ncbi:MAG: hypothetical protein M1828_000348 [Chrysothrix sp. TS-e1954]|nr:MAG: hypothetical protein M1828_000348 [Chrysothrix sp. TS-e1954]
MGPNLMTLPSELRQEIIRLAIWHECSVASTAIPKRTTQTPAAPGITRTDSSSSHKSWKIKRGDINQYELNGFCGHALTYSRAKPYLGDNITTARNLRLVFNRTINTEVYCALKQFKAHLKIHRVSLCAESSRNHMHEHYVCDPPHDDCRIQVEVHQRKDAWCVDQEGLETETDEVDTLLSIARPGPLVVRPGMQPRLEISHVVNREFRCTRALPDGRLEYRVRFAGHPPSSDEWVPAGQDADDPAFVKYDAEHPVPDAHLPKKLRGRAKVRRGYPVFNKVHVLKMECKDCGEVSMRDPELREHGLRFFVQPRGKNINPRWISEKKLEDWYPEEHKKCFRIMSDGVERNEDGSPVREIDRIVHSEKRVRPGEFLAVTQYQVRWRGFAPKDDSWLKMEEMRKGFQDHLNDFYAEQIRRDRLLGGMCCSDD